MLRNALNLSIHDPILIYGFLALYGLLTALLITHVHSRFRAAAKTLKLLQAEWQNAESRHESYLGIAKEKLSQMKTVLPSACLPAARSGVVGADVRNQVVVMADRGTSLTDIARTCSLQEGEVEVILGMARLQRWAKSAG